MYFATAVFTSDGNDKESGEHFSLAMTLSEPLSDSLVPARFRFFAPDLLGRQLVSGAKFLVMEGPAVVGVAEISVVFAF